MLISFWVLLEATGNVNLFTHCFLWFELGLKKTKKQKTDPDPKRTSRSSLVGFENEELCSEDSKDRVQITSISTQVKLPDSSSSAPKFNPVTAASLVRPMFSGLTLSAPVKAGESIYLCMSEFCARVYVLSGTQRGLSLWLYQFNYCCHLTQKISLGRMKRKGHFLSPFKLLHTLWQDHPLTKRHGRFIWIYATQSLVHKHTRTQRQTAHTFAYAHSSTQTHHLECTYLWYAGIEIHRTE